MINSFFIYLAVAALIASVIDRKVKQSCLIDFLAVVCAVCGVSLIATGLNHTIESTVFIASTSVWIALHVVKKIMRVRKK